MRLSRRVALATFSLLTLATSAQAATITVNSVADLVSPAFGDTSPNTSSGLGASNGTPNACTLREAILMVNGDMAANSTECTGAAIPPTGRKSYCPLPAQPRECPQTLTGTGPVDTIIINISGTIELDYTLPAINQPVRIVGIGTDQTVLTGYAPYLAAMNPPAAAGSLSTANATVDLPMFQIGPGFKDGGQVTIENLQVRGTRVQYFRSPNAARAGCDATAGGTAVDCLAAENQPCDSVANNGVADCPTPASEPNKRIINFGGVVMDNGSFPLRKTLNIKDARFVCNRRGAIAGSSPVAVYTGGLPFTGTAPSSAQTSTSTNFEGSEATLRVTPTANGGAVSVTGKASVVVSNSNFFDNIADSGQGGAIFAGGRDDASPSLSVDGGVYGVGTGCTDTVFVSDSTDTDGATAGAQLSNSVQACASATAAGFARSCPTVTTAFTPYAPGNMAGTADQILALPALPAAAAVPTPPLSAAENRDGGAISVNASVGNSVASTANIGNVVISNARFINNQAAGNGGALSLSNVALPDTTQPAFQFTNVLFGDNAGTGNTARLNGGAVSIRGNANQSARTNISLTSFSNNAADGYGGALFYTTTGGRPIDFNVVNSRFGSNVAGFSRSTSGGLVTPATTSTADGGAIYATDNGVTASGLLDISKATFDFNVAADAGGALACNGVRRDSQLTNVTISGNSAARGGGLYIGNFCNLSINSSTITQNSAVAAPTSGSTEGRGVQGGGGIFVDGSIAPSGGVNLRNTILAANTAVPLASNSRPGTDSDNGSDCSAADNSVLQPAEFANPADRGFNFIGSARGCGQVGSTSRPFFAGTNASGDCTNPSPQSGDWVGSFINSNFDCRGAISDPLNPGLLTLRDNGGPAIAGAPAPTHLAGAGSRTVDGGDLLGCRDGKGVVITQDQREAPRPASSGTRCDIGAVESGSVPGSGGGGSGGGGGGGGSSTPTVIASRLSIPSGTVSLDPTITTPFEMLRMQVRAPSTMPISVTTLRISGEAPGLGVTGNYSSIRGVRIFEVDSAGNLGNLIYTSGETKPAGLNNGGAFDAALQTPLQLAAGEARTIAVVYVFGTESQLASAQPALMIAAGSLAFLPLLGMVGVGRRRMLAVAVVVMILGAAGCGGGGSGDDDGTGGSGGGTNTERTFRAGVRQIGFSYGSPTQNAVQNVTILGDVITAKP